MGFRWIVLWGGAGLLIAWREGNLLIAVITAATCLILMAVRNVILRLIVIQKHFGLNNLPDDSEPDIED
jgi:CHASE2 domain-containing sensor protein